MKWGIIGWARYDNSIGREEEGVIAPPVRESVVVSDQRERGRSIVRIVINLSAATWRRRSRKGVRGMLSPFSPRRCWDLKCQSRDERKRWKRERERAVRTSCASATCPMCVKNETRHTHRARERTQIPVTVRTTP